MSHTNGSYTNVSYNNVSCTNANYTNESYTYDELYEPASEYAWETVGNSLEWDSVQEQRLEHLCEKYGVEE